MSAAADRKREPKRLLVTGGCGFIGSSFIRHVLALPDIRVVNLDALTYAGDPANVGEAADSPRYELVRGNICDGALVGTLCDEHDIDAIVHFAAESHVDRSIVGPGAFVQTNIVGTFELLDVVRQRKQIHFHHVSTDEVFGSLGPTGRFDESTAYDPRSPYAASKAASDHLVRAYGHTYGLSTTLSNCSNNYGPYQFPEKLIPLMVTNMLSGKPLPVYGDGSNVRDWLHVDDHSSALWTIIQTGESGATYAVGGDAELNNLDLLHRLIDTVAALADRDRDTLKATIRFVTDRPGHDQRYAIDCSKLKRELGWTRRYDVDAGLRDTVRWYLEHEDWVERATSGDYREWIEQNYGARAST